MTTQPPLALYVHTPWCVSKCPYCDFNSRALPSSPSFDPYVDRLLADLAYDLTGTATQRPIETVFIGGGTPSLFPESAVRKLMDGIRASSPLRRNAEITLEANPGTLDEWRLAGYREAGVNRLSIGVQSLSRTQLRRLGRIHDPSEARRCVRLARSAGFDNINLDMMFALPGQTLATAAEDLEALIELRSEHISYYQLTLEPGTGFHRCSPAGLPGPDLAAEIAAQGVRRLAEAGYRRYEVSAYAREGYACRHNLNYWRFGDYLGIGAGAHGKLTEIPAGEKPWRIRRTVKRIRPDDYLSAPVEDLIEEESTLAQEDLPLEFALNALRMVEGFDRSLFGRTTGLPWSQVSSVIERAVENGLLVVDGKRVIPTPFGQAFLDDLVARFIPA